MDVWNASIFADLGPSTEVLPQSVLLPSAPLIAAMLLQVCASELERGNSILQKEANLPYHQQRLSGPRGKDYLRALGQLYLSSLLLQASMETHVQHPHRPLAYQDHLSRCSRAWRQGKPFRAQAQLLSK